MRAFILLLALLLPAAVGAQAPADTAEVIVEPATVVQVLVEPARFSGVPGDTIHFVAIGLDEDGDIVESGFSVTWSQSGPVLVDLIVTGPLSAMAVVRERTRGQSTHVIATLAAPWTSDPDGPTSWTPLEQIPLQRHAGNNAYETDNLCIVQTFILNDDPLEQIYAYVGWPMNDRTREPEEDCLGVLEMWLADNEDVLMWDEPTGSTEPA